jgi:hypothetical protein
MKLIIEEVQDAKQMIVEGKDGGPKQYFIEGTFMQADVANRNKRMYPKALLEREHARYNRFFIQDKRSVGEMGHPEGPNINMERVSHYIQEMHQDGPNWYGKAKIMDTPYGRIVKNFMDEGIKFGVSTRGCGTLREHKDGLHMVNDDYHLACVDIVHDPSAPDAFMNGIMEGKEWLLTETGWKEQDLEAAKKGLQEANNRDREAMIMIQMESFFNKLRGL